MREINEIIIHCTATKEGTNIPPSMIKSWHIARGFNDIGYHFVVTLDGKIHIGRIIEDIGAHCRGHNRHSIGICYVGGLDVDGKPKDTRTEAQKNSIIDLLKSLKIDYPKATIHGHNEFANKACPCFDVSELVKTLYD